MTHYDDGRRFEWDTRKDLRTNGYDVFRMAGSKTKVDLIATKPGQALYIQCKRDGYIPPAERLELLRLAAHIGAVPLVAWKVVGKSRVRYDRLTGPGSRDHEPWVLDFAEAGA